jgi:hypothetical protein
MTKITGKNEQIFFLLKILTKQLCIILNKFLTQIGNHNRHQIEFFAFHGELQKRQMHFQTVFIFLNIFSNF